VDVVVVKVPVLIHTELVLAPTHTLRQTRVQKQFADDDAEVLEGRDSVNSVIEPPD
jgi:hypothetical protein